MERTEIEEVPKILSNIFSEIEKNQQLYIETLGAAVAVQSVSASPERRDDVIAMVQWFGNKLKALGTEIELADVGFQPHPEDKNKTLKLPPVLLGTLGKDPKKKTVCIYGHLDVQPAAKEDGWDTEPFVLTEKNGKLYGRGASDDKGPVLCWLHAIEAYQKLNEPLPVNLKFIFEGMEESGSEGLDKLLNARKASFLRNVDYFCISDNYWLGTEKPCLTYGTRGLCYFNIEIEGASKDLHSGVYGGAVNEAIADLIYLLNTLVDSKGKILINGICDDVPPVTDEERQIYHKIDFSVQDYKNEIGCNELLHKEDKVKLLMSRWRFPTLSIHGIQGAFSEPGSKTVIPRKVIGKFSVRVVPNMVPEKVESLVLKHLDEAWSQRGSKNKFKAWMIHGSKAWVTNYNHNNFKAARKATRHVYRVDPDLTREGGSIPVTLTFEELTGKSVILIPVGACDDGAHSQNEKMNKRNYIEGTKVLAAYLYEIAQLPEV